MIKAGKVPGFDIVLDTCGTDAPVLLYSERGFVGMNDPGFDERHKRASNLAAYVDWVISGDHSKPFEPPAPKKKSEPELSLEAVEADSYSDDTGKTVRATSQIDDTTPIETDETDAQAAGGSQDSFEVIDTYSRAQAIEDGVLIDVTETAKEAGIIYPTAVTQALWDGYIVPPESLKGIQDVQGRLWDVLTMFRFSAKASKSSGQGQQTLYFKTMFQMPAKTGRQGMETVTLKTVCGPGDGAEPVITIMLINED